MITNPHFFRKYHSTPNRPTNNKKNGQVFKFTAFTLKD